MSGRRNRQFRVSHAIEFWGNRAQAWKKLSLLERKGWIARIERGKYLVIPLEAGPERTWSEDTYVIASDLIQPSAIAYWSAIRHWDWTEQIPRAVTVQTTARKSLPSRQVFGVRYEFARVPKAKFFGHVNAWRGGVPVLVTDKEKTLIDCADKVSRAGGIEELVKAVRAAAGELSWRTLDAHVQKFPNRSVAKRLGYLFETCASDLPNESIAILEKWRHHLSSGVVLLQPGVRAGGRIVSRWRIRINVAIP
jgi:predicted transcriptional regulator of viral defense system